MVMPPPPSKIDENREMMKTWFSRMDSFSYRALVLAENDLEKYWYIRAKYTIVQITELYYFKVIYKAVNG